MSRSKKYLAYFSGWENEDCWRVINLDGSTTAYSPKRRYTYQKVYIIYVRKNKVVKTRLAPKKVQALFDEIGKLRIKIIDDAVLMSQNRLKV